MKRRLGVIADDLTGAMDAGVQLLKKGIGARVLIDYEKGDEAVRDTDVVIVNTQSRNIDPQPAYIKVKESIGFLNRNEIEFIYKKVDSTLRGNIGKELDAVLDSSDKELVLLAPALPFNGRNTLGGYQYVNGVKLEETEFGSDPFSPVRHSYIPSIISRQSSRDVSTLDLETIRKGEKALAAEILRAYNQGCRIIVMDAVEDGDLEIIARAAQDLRIRALLCGSAGLFQHMPFLLGRDEVDGELEEGRIVRPQKAGGSSRGPVVVLSGSPAAASKRQIEFAAEHLNNAGVINLAGDFQSGLKINGVEEMRKIRERIEGLLPGCDVLIIDAAGGDRKSLLRHYGGNVQLLHRDSNMLLDLLSGILSDILDKVEVKGLVMIGGDTAFQICKNLGVYGISILGEIEPYVPAGILMGGKLDGLPVVTKAGGFGSQTVLISAMGFFGWGSS